MNRNDVAYLINTTPKYFYILPLHLTLLQRYADNLKWPIYIATEAYTDEYFLNIVHSFQNISIIPLTQEQEPFLESRAAATRVLPSSIKYVFPIQEDFLLEGRPVTEIIEEALSIFDTTTEVASCRLMPCPGPLGETFGDTRWKVLCDKDSYLFTYQATLWKREAYQEYMEEVIHQIHLTYGTLNPSKILDIQIRLNVAENNFGKTILRHIGNLHLAWPRVGKQPNAVYLCAWPYRPTAIVQGKLEKWADELAKREGILLEERVPL